MSTNKHKPFSCKTTILALLIVTILALMLTGCGKKPPQGPGKDDADITDVQPGDSTNIFEDIDGYYFEFSSGAGGWGTEFRIAPDGSFSGIFHDNDMGDAGNGYPNGTLYYSAFHGQMSAPVQIDENTWQFRVESIDYDNPVGTEEIIDGVLYKYSEVYGLEGDGPLNLYVPGAPVSVLSEDVMSWVRYNIGEGANLDRYIIENVSEGYGMFSYIDGEF